MKAPKVESYPRMIIVGKEQIKASYNRHLLIPYRENEILRVAPIEEQKPNRKYDDHFQYVKSLTDQQFRQRYVTVLRRDPESGEWSHKYVIAWANVELLNSLTKNK